MSDAQRMTDAVREVNAWFKYEKDSEQFGFRDIWKTVTPEHPVGDCEDYALGVAFLLAGKSTFRLVIGLLFRRYKIRFHKHRVRGSGHASLEYKGFVADNISKQVTTVEQGWLDKNQGYNKGWAFPATFIAIKILWSKVWRAVT